MRYVVALSRGGKTGVVGLFAFDAAGKNKLLPNGIDSALVTQKPKQALDRFQLGMSMQQASCQDRY